MMTQGIQSVVVLDSGGGTCKLGLAQQSDQEPSIFPNGTARIKGERQVLVGHEILEARDVSALAVRRPVERGYVVSWESQREIWSRALRKLLPQVSPTASGLVLTEPYMNLVALREAALHTVFRELGFASVVFAPPAVLALRWHLYSAPQPAPGTFAAFAAAAGCALVIDVGFSFTHAVPVFDGHVIGCGVRRIDLGGKALTNYMKELVSFRSINMMDEGYLLEYIKNRLCFVSQNTAEDLALSRRRDSPHRCEWLLPDGVTSTWGRLRGPEDPPRGPKDPILVVNNERFMVPEALFNPSDIGLGEAGIAEMAAEAVKGTHPHLHSLLWANVVVIGGTASCPGFVERLKSDLRPLVPDDYDLNVNLAKDPHLAAYRGGCLLGASREEYSALAVTRAEYQKHGAAACGKWDE